MRSPKLTVRFSQSSCILIATVLLADLHCKNRFNSAKRSAKHSAKRKLPQQQAGGEAQRDSDRQREEREAAAGGLEVLMSIGHAEEGVVPAAKMRRV